MQLDQTQEQQQNFNQDFLNSQPRAHTKATIKLTIKVIKHEQMNNTITRLGKQHLALRIEP